MASPPPSSRNDEDDEDFEDDGSFFSLDYEYIGPRQPVYRSDDDNDSVASHLSSSPSAPAFDMWDEDLYSSNDYTWQSNDMRLTHFIKHRQRQLAHTWRDAPSFWRKERGWPRQMPFSATTTNHDQASHALRLVPADDLAQAEGLFCIYRDSIVQCGQEPPKDPQLASISSSSSSISSSSTPCSPPTTTCLPQGASSAVVEPPATDSAKFCATHYSVSLPSGGNNSSDTTASSSSSSSSDGSKGSSSNSSKNDENTATSGKKGDIGGKQQESDELEDKKKCIEHCVPYTKFIRRMAHPRHTAYLPLAFEPMCFDQRYGYLAVGGLEGEFELYCCMDPSVPPKKLWTTTFKRHGNLMLMTNSLQIVRYACDDHSYDIYLFACMNEAGILVYRLPPHHYCMQHPSTIPAPYAHLHAFDHLPINDARVSPDGSKLVCVGDGHHVFVIDLACQPTLTFALPHKLTIPPAILQDLTCYTSQHVAWSPTGTYFAHTSDTHDRVLVWHASTLRLLSSIHTAGYTYAIQFHPVLDNILVFANRYGYFHTVDLHQQATATAAAAASSSSSSLFGDNDNDTPVSPASSLISAPSAWAPSPIASSSPSVVAPPPPPPPPPSGNYQRSEDDEKCDELPHPRQEITMVSFRGEKDRRLRILAKINGLQWSLDGLYLYVATKKRVLAYEFMHLARQLPGRKVASLYSLARTQLCSHLTLFQHKRRQWHIAKRQRTTQRCLSPPPRKRTRRDSQPDPSASPPSPSPSSFSSSSSSSTTAAERARRYRHLWPKYWTNIPIHIRQQVWQDLNQVSHWYQ
ncbi:hypothetical protein BC940DRAFT_287761 [Gongronella butleri]|nr:hypothetical protein BC940DRAFT_287761 [Gongronella butleri]